MRQSRHIVVLLLIVCISMLSFGGLLAQDNDTIDLTERFNSTSRRLDFFYPVDWTIDDTDDNFISVANDKITIEFYNPELTKTILDLGGETLDEGLTFFLSTLEFDEEAKITNPVEFDDESFLGTLISQGADSFYVLLIDSRVGDDEDQVFVRISGKTLDLLSSEDLFLQITKTVGNLIPIRGETSANSSNTTAVEIAPPTDEPVEPCFVFASANDGTSIHVGPGNNRTSIAFLSVIETGYEVLGTANASDGSKWWRLDKLEAAPEKANVINEAWVADAEVDQQGGCDEVGTVKAPPIIRVRPTSAPTTATSNNGNGSQPPASTPMPTPDEDSTELFVNFYADPSTIFEGECTTLFWDVRNASSVSYEGFQTSAQGASTECPLIDTTYTLEVINSSGGTVISSATVFVNPLFLECYPSDLPVFDTNGFINTGEVQAWYIYLDPCESPMTIFIEMYSTGSGDLDPYIDVYIDGVYVGSDDDGGGTPNAYIEVFVPAGSRLLEVYAYDFNGENSGPYDLLAESLGF